MGRWIPWRGDTKTDIDAGNSYVIVNNGMIVGTFSFIIGKEPTYQVIKMEMDR